MARESVRVVGLEGVLKTLRQLPPEMVSKNGGPVKAALRKAAQVLQAQAQENVQRIVDTPNIGGLPTESIGLLKRSIVVARGKQMPSGGKGEIQLVKIRRNQKYPAELQDKTGKLSAAKVGRLLEQGTERRSAMPWLRPAFDAKKGEAVSTFVVEINKRLARLVKKLARQNQVKQ